MKEKKQTGIKIAVFMLGILVILGIAGCVFLKMNQSAPKISHTEETTEIPVEESAAESDQETKSVEKNLEGFSVRGKYDGTAQPMTQGEEDSEYLCAFSSERLLTEDDIIALMLDGHEDLPDGKGIIRMAINEMYARHGYVFGKDEIQAYFEQKEWYLSLPYYSDDTDVITQGMTELELTNIDFLSRYDTEVE